MRFILLIICFTLSFPAFAGSRTGYRLVFIAGSPQKTPETTELLRDYFNAELPSSTYDCESVNRDIQFEFVYFYQRPKGITDELVSESVNSNKKSATEKLRKVLRTFKNSEINQGFDDLLVFKSDQNNFELTTIGSVANGYKKTARISNKTGLNANSLKKLFCDSLADLPYAYPGL